MAIATDYKLIKEKRIDKETTLTISQHLMSKRIFVEFASKNFGLVLQKTFQDTLDGKMASEAFAKSIKSTGQLKAYFGLGKRK